MPRYNIYVDITGFEDDTINIRLEVESRLIEHGYRDGAEVAHDALFPLSNDLVKFLEEANKLVNIVRYINDDSDEFDRMHEDDLTQFDLHNEERFF